MPNNENKKRMADIIMAEPDEFFILMPDNKTVPILGYEKMIVHFGARIEYREGIRDSVLNPLITYYVHLSDSAKTALKELFKNSDDDGDLTIHSRGAKIVVGKDRYIFPVVVTAIPSHLHGTSYFNRERRESSGRVDRRLLELDSIKIEIDSRCLGQTTAFFQELDDKVLSRFEILDI